MSAEPVNLRVLSYRPAGAAEEVVAQHLDWLRLRNLRENTVTARRGSLARLRAFVGVPLLEVSAEQMDAWQRDMLPRLTAKSRQHEISHAREFYRWAAGNDLIPRDPSRVLIRPRTPRGVPRPIAEKDLAGAIDSAPRRIRAWLVLAAYAGLRACEIAPLERGHILDEDEPPALLVAAGKGGHQRTVPLNSLVLAELRRYGLPGRGPVFPLQDGRRGPISPNALSQMVNRYLHERQVGATLHQCRHRYATNAYKISNDLRVVQELLGHSSPSTTALYAAHSSGKGHEAVEQMGAGSHAVTVAGAAPTVVGRTLSEEDLHGLLAELRERELQLAAKEATIERTHRAIAAERAAERAADELDAATQAVLTSTVLTSTVPPSMAPPRWLPTGMLPDRELSDRERAVLLLVAEGLSNREIGKKLGISALTVKSHLARISRRLGVGTRVEMAVWVVRDAAVYEELRAKAIGKAMEAMNEVLAQAAAPRPTP